jgi:hypothetical protein
LTPVGENSVALCECHSELFLERILHFLAEPFDLARLVIDTFVGRTIVLVALGDAGGSFGRIFIAELETR